MSIRLYFPDNIVKSSTSLLSKEHTHYLANVMRLKRGAIINLFNQQGEWQSEIIFLEKDRIEVKFLKKIKEPNNLSNIELAICLVKKNAMENILQKATELGVIRIVPISSERTEVKELNYERAKKIIVEATEQSNQLTPPEITKITKLSEFLKNFEESKKILFADVNSKENLKVENLKNYKTLSILIGPEGDFSPSEREAILQSTNVTPFTISSNILRSDTAVISAISLVNFINKFN